MAESGPIAVHAHLLPTLIPPGALRGGVAVVIDVLRATTVMIQSLASGCRAVIPCREIAEAVSVRDSARQSRVVLAGERQGLPIAGFDRGNSPGDFTPEVCDGATLVMTTTNGTSAILASIEAATVFVAAFSNLNATVEALLHLAQPVHLVCAGTDGQISWEDGLLAGAIGERLLARGAKPGNDAARIAVALWVGEQLALEPADEDHLFRCLKRGRGGRRVHELGLEADIREASRVDQFDFIARLEREPLRIVRVERRATGLTQAELFSEGR